MSGRDDAPGVLRNMGITVTRWQLYLTASAAIAVVNCIVGGTAAAFAVDVAFDPQLVVPITAGALVALASFVLHLRADRARHEQGVPIEPLFPTPPGGAATAG